MNKQTTGYVAINASGKFLRLSTNQLDSQWVEIHDAQVFADKDSADRERTEAGSKARMLIVAWMPVKVREYREVRLLSLHSLQTIPNEAPLLGRESHED